MTSRSLVEYLETSEEGVGSLSKIPSSVKKAGSRSIRATRLNLTKEQIFTLQRELELNTGKKYVNKTMVNDCATMIKRVLEKNSDLSIPAAIDAFPSVSSTYLSMRRVLGDDRVGPTQLLLSSKSNSSKLHAARNAYIAILEGKVLLATAPLNLAQRAALDWNSGGDDLQYHTEDVKKEIETWRTEAHKTVETEMKDIFGGIDFEAQLKKIHNPRDREKKREEAREALNLVSARLIREADEASEYSEADFRDLVIAAEKRMAVAEQNKKYSAWLNRIGR